MSGFFRTAGVGVAQAHLVASKLVREVVVDLFVERSGRIHLLRSQVLPSWNDSVEFHRNAVKDVHDSKPLVTIFPVLPHMFVEGIDQGVALI